MSTSHSVNQFSLQRFRLVLKRYLVLNQRTWIIGFLCVGGFLLLIAILPLLSGIINVSQPGFKGIRDTAIFFYMLGGLVLTSMIFSEIHIPTRSFQFLTLPSTTFEKLLAAWFTGTVVYTVGALLGIFILSVFIETIEGINTGLWRPFSLFDPFTADILSTILTYFFYQSIFLLGAVYFQKNNFLKTLLVIIAFFLGFFFFFSIAMLIFGIAQTQNQEFFLNFQLNAREWNLYVKYLIGPALTLFFLWLSYLQLKNSQIV